MPSKECLNIAGRPQAALEGLEPYDGKLSRTVPRGAGCGNATMPTRLATRGF